MLAGKYSAGDAQRRLTAAGVEFISPPQHMEPGRCASCYFYDPDGNILELHELFARTPIRAAFGIDQDASQVDI